MGWGVLERGKSEASKGWGGEGRRERGIRACACIITGVLLTAYRLGEGVGYMCKGRGKEELHQYHTCHQ